MGQAAPAGARTERLTRPQPSTCAGGSGGMCEGVHACVRIPLWMISLKHAGVCDVCSARRRELRQGPAITRNAPTSGSRAPNCSWQMGRERGRPPANLLRSSGGLKSSCFFLPCPAEFDLHSCQHLAGLGKDVFSIVGWFLSLTWWFSQASSITVLFVSPFNKNVFPFCWNNWSSCRSDPHCNQNVLFVFLSSEHKLKITVKTI